MAMLSYTTFMAMLWLGLVSALYGVFLPWLLFPVCLLLGWIVTASTTARGISMDRWTWSVLLLSLLAACASYPPGHLLQLAWDPVVYVQSGVVIAREGRVAFDLASFHELPRILRDLVSFPSQPTSPFAGMVFSPEGNVVPVFPLLYPVWIAWCHAIGGLDVALSANILLLPVSGLLLFAMVRRWFGPGWGVVAAAGLMFFPVQWWQARFPTAELLAQVLILGGFLLLQEAVASDEGRKRLASLSGFSFGLAVLARVDSLLVMVPVLLLLFGGWNRRSWRPVIVSVAVPAVLLTLQAFLQTAWTGSPYFPRRSWILGGMLVAGLMFLAQCILVFIRRDRQEAYWNEGGWIISRGVPVLWLVIMLIYAVLRPWMAGRTSEHAGFNFDRVWGHGSSLWRVWVGQDAWNLQMVAQVAGWPLLVVALSGLALLLVRRDAWPVRRIWVLMVLPVWCVLMYSLHHEREMMWMCRRLVPVITPSIIIGAVAFFSAGWSFRNGIYRWAVLSLMALFAVVVVAGLREPVGRAWSIREFHGTKKGFDALADGLDRDAVYFAGVTGFGATLRTIYGLDALELYDPTEERREALMKWLPAWPAGRPVYLVSPVPLADHETRWYSLCTSVLFEAGIYEQPAREIPLRETRLASPFFVYRVSSYSETELHDGQE